MGISTHTLSLRSGILCLGILFTVTAALAADKSIPRNQIGAKAGADYKGDGLSVTATDSGARLHCVFQRLDGDATPQGLWLTSTVSSASTDRFRVTAIETGRGDLGLRRQSNAATPLSETLPTTGFAESLQDHTKRDSSPSPGGEGWGEGERTLKTRFPSLDDTPNTYLSPTGAISLDNQTVRFTRLGLIEEYTVSMDGIRQDFIIPEAPDPREASWSAAVPCRFGTESPEKRQRTGAVQKLAHEGSQLVLTLSVSGVRVEPAPDGATLILENSHRRIAYNRLRVTDATGKQLPAHIEVSPVGDEVTSLKSPFDQNVGDEVTSLKSSDLFANNFEATNPLRLPGADNPQIVNREQRERPALSWKGLRPQSAPGLSIVINDTGATYPLRIDPTFSDANWVSLGGVRGTADGGIYSPDGGVLCAVTDSTGNLYIGGSFYIAGNVIANNVAEWNGSTWSALGAGISGGDLLGPAVLGLAVSGTNLYVCGDFTAAGDESANNIAQWNGSSWSALGSGLPSDAAGSYVYALAVSGSTLYAGGGFTNAGGNAANGVAQWNGSSWSALGSGVNGIVAALAVSGGTLYAGGYFTNAGSVSANYIAQWNGSSWSALGSGMNGDVYVLTASGNALYAGGGFTTAGGNTANHVAQWNGNSWSDLGSGFNGAVYALAVSSNYLYAGGNFITAGEVSAIDVARWNGSSWSALASGIPEGDQGPAVSVLVVSSNTLYAGGDFFSAGAATANNIAQWNGTSWSAVGSGFNNDVDAFAAVGSNIYVGGSFTTAGSVFANYIAQWNGNSWSALGTGMNGAVSALAVSGSNVYAGGSFTTAGGVSANYIAQWNGSSWSALGSGVSGGVGALVVSGSNLYAGGNFTAAGGVSVNYIAQWNGSSWSALGSGMSGGAVYALAVSGSNLYAGGRFTNAGGVSANYIARWNGNSWSAMGSGMDGYVSSLAPANNILFAGGNFGHAGGMSVGYVAQWNGSSWSSLGSGVYSTVNSVAALGNTLYVGGPGYAEGVTVTVNGVAQWNGSSWSALGSGLNGYVTTVAVLGNNLYVGGEFNMAGTNVSAYVAEALLSIPSSPLVILTTDGNFGFTNGLFGFDIAGPAGSNVLIQTSTDLQNWTTLQTNQFNNLGLLYFSDSQSPITTRRFYQAVLP